MDEAKAELIADDLVFGLTDCLDETPGDAESEEAQPYVHARTSEGAARHAKLGALAVMALVITLLVRAVSSVEETTEPPGYEQVQATGEEGIEYRGATYFISEQAADKYVLASTSDGFEGTAVLYELQGTPVTLILYNTVFVIPENLPDNKWDLIAHPLGGGSVTQQVTDGEGNPIVGEGQIVEATLEGDAIKITTDAGEVMTVSLV